MTSQIPITFVHQVYRETLLNDDDEDTNENDYVDIEVSTPCLQGYILSETSFPRDVNVIFCSILQPSSDSFTPVSAIISDGETNKSLDDISDHSATDVDTYDGDNDTDKFASENKQRGIDGCGRGRGHGEQGHGPRAGHKLETNCRRGRDCSRGKGRRVNARNRAPPVII